MKNMVCRLAAICGVQVALCFFCVGQDPPPPHAFCSDHPAVTRDEVMKARSAGHGIHQQYLLDRDARPVGREVAPLREVGGGDCPVESTARGAAAAAVGALRYNGDLHCSAVLVKSTMILTAAHCILGFDQDKLEFVLGVDSNHIVQRSKIYSAEVHQNYDDGHFGVNDIAYAYLDHQMTEATPVDVTESVLPRTGIFFILHVGYGIAGAQPGARRCVTIPVLDRCEQGYSYSTANMNTCNGDSGGAAFRSSGDKMILAGMTDWGDGACAEFGVDVDTGSYVDWIQARKSGAPRNVTYARVEVRRPLTAPPDDVATTISGYTGPAKFESLYKGRWVTWDATVEDVEPRNEDEIPNTCSVRAKAGQNLELLLHQYMDGCSLTATHHIRFTGRLAQLSPRWVDVVFPEAVDAAQQAAGDAVGEWVLSRVAITTREVREKRSRDVRLESRHGSWSGRVTECLPVVVEAPWHLDTTVPVTFAPAHQDHAAYEGTPDKVTGAGFCVPLWAEGYGGTQVFGATVDAGMLGVISGTVQFGVVKNARGR